MPAEWARDVRDQCSAARVPLVKQMSKREPIPDDLMIREFPLASLPLYDAVAQQVDARRTNSTWSRPFITSITRNANWVRWFGKKTPVKDCAMSEFRTITKSSELRDAVLAYQREIALPGDAGEALRASIAYVQAWIATRENPGWAVAVGAGQVWRLCRSNRGTRQNHNQGLHGRDAERARNYGGPSHASASDRPG